MKIKTKLILCKDGKYRVKTTYSNGRRKTIRFFSAEELEVSPEILPCVDFRSKILERLSK
jgi:hypothetical protein